VTADLNEIVQYTPVIHSTSDDGSHGPAGAMTQPSFRGMKWLGNIQRQAGRQRISRWW
jgi:hypothetical protein